jgi:hypothetical protein
MSQSSCLSLVDDEVMTCYRNEFRLQVWRGQGSSHTGRSELQPVVLMLGIPGQPPPDWYTTRLAHIALRFVSAPPIPLFFQYSLLEGKPRACKVTFQVDGTHLRPLLHYPTYDKVDPAVLERVFCINAPRPEGKVNARAVIALS